MMYLIIIFISPLYFLIRGKIGGLILNAILYCVAVAFLVTIVFSWVGFPFWLLAVGHAAWHYRRDLMMEQTEMIITKVTEAQVKGKIVQQGESYVDPGDTKKCPMCAETIKYEAKLCKHCGHKFSRMEEGVSKSAEMKGYTNQAICPQCKQSVNPGAQFCGGCGYKLEKAGEVKQ